MENEHDPDDQLVTWCSSRGD